MSQIGSLIYGITHVCIFPTEIICLQIIEYQILNCSSLSYWFEWSRDYWSKEYTLITKSRTSVNEIESISPPKKAPFLEKISL